MSEINRHHGEPAPTVGTFGHGEVAELGDMNVKLTNWLRERELGYREISFGFQDFRGRRQQQKDTQQ